MKGGPRQERGGLAWGALLLNFRLQPPQTTWFPTCRAPAGGCCGAVPRWVVACDRAAAGVDWAGAGWESLDWLVAGLGANTVQFLPPSVANSSIPRPRTSQQAASRGSSVDSLSWKPVQARYLTSPRRLIFDRPCHRPAKRCVFSDPSPGLNADCPLFRLAADQLACVCREGQTQDRLVLLCEQTPCAELVRAVLDMAFACHVARTLHAVGS